MAEGIPVASGGTPIPVEDYAYDAEGNSTASHLPVFCANRHYGRMAAQAA